MTIDKIAKEFSNITSKYGTYAVIGNHDGWQGKEEIVKELEKKNIKVLPPKKKVSSFDKTYKYTFTPHSLYHKIFILSTGNRYIFINIFLH